MSTPIKLSDLSGLDKIIDSVNGFLADFQNNVVGHKNACLLYGAQGTGKTSIVRCVANTYNFPLYEINGSDIRTTDKLAKALAPLVNNNIRGVQHCIILIDEADGLNTVKPKKEDEAVVKMTPIELLKTLIHKTKHPIFLTANNYYPLRLLKQDVVEIQFYRHKPATISQILRRHTTDEQLISQICEHANGDIRTALNMLNTTPEQTFTEMDIFSSVNKILTNHMPEGVESDNNELMAWLEENAGYRLLGASHLMFYQNLCNVARMSKRSSDMTRKLILNGSQLTRFRINEFQKVLRPIIYEKVKDGKKKREVLRSLEKKLGMKGGIKETLQVLQLLSRNEKWLKDVFIECGLDEDEVALLMNTNTDDIVVKGFVESNRKNR